MEISMRIKSPKESGFALLITLIVVGVVISVGLSLLDLSIKQVRLSTNAKESEIAFHAANAGMECARYIRRTYSDEMEDGDSINPSCFGVNADNPSLDNPIAPALDDSSDIDAYRYFFDFTWGNAPDQRCTQVVALVASASVFGNGGDVTNMDDIVPGYPDGNNLSCDAGARCTVLSVQGYNKPCSAIGSYGTVQREVLLQF